MGAVSGFSSRPCSTGSLAEVLAEKIETEFMEMALATQVGRGILRENAAELFLG